MRLAAANMVRLTLVPLAMLAAVALAPKEISAQAWAPEEQEAINHLRACWATWVTEDYDTWMKTCNLDPSGSYWNTEESAPNSQNPANHFLRDIVLQGFEDTDVVAWDIRPLRVTSWGDVVGVYFSTVLHVRNSEGKVAVVQDRRFEIVRKENGRWSVVGGMSVPGAGGE